MTINTTKINRNIALRKRLLFNITDDDCEQQVLSVAQQTTTPAGGETTVVVGLQQLWSDAKSNRKPY